jgi:putative GTP pyrophosphokinase
MFSKSQIDRLGDRLRKGLASYDDIVLLDEYRRSFESAVADVAKVLTVEANLNAVARPAKSTLSITQKLRRESIRLSQMQDIAGFRIVLKHAAIQDFFARTADVVFDSVEVIDRRANPSFGYRAVHLIVTTCERMIEVQIRSEPQHLWAQLSEAYADRFGAEIKYGGGDPAIQAVLMDCSEQIAQLEYWDTARFTSQDQSEIDAFNQRVDAGWVDLRGKLTTLLHTASGTI